MAALVVGYSNSEGTIGPGPVLIAVAVVTTLLVWTERTRSAAPIVPTSGFGIGRRAVPALSAADR